ncbi:MAG: tetratricopeptide repeat protein [Anaerolineales bacterium]|jgi:tetratricopeptide (TPR) repeat protein
MNLSGDELKLGRREGNNDPRRMAIYLVLIVLFGALLALQQTGQVQPLFLGTPIATRNAGSYADEAQAHFSSGDLEAAIASYQQAAELDPNNPEWWARLARVQVYRSSLLTTLDERRAQLAEARQSIENAVAANDQDPFSQTIRALVYDWSASAEVKDKILEGDTVLVQATVSDGGELTARVIQLVNSATPSEIEPSQEQGEATGIFTGVVEIQRLNEWIISGRVVRLSDETIQVVNRREEFLLEALQSATFATTLDPNNPLGLAFKAEVHVDQGQVALAADLARQAVESIEAAGEDYEYAMDVYRVYGTVLENQGLYLQAIIQYQNAVSYSPNLTFLYLQIGVNYRKLRQIDEALDNFATAAQINQQLGIEDPNPYLSIGRTYAQQGDFFIAALNMERALAIDPNNPELYAQLGTVYFQARNYESSIPIFECAVEGCSDDQAREYLCTLEIMPCEDGVPVRTDVEGAEEEFNYEVTGLELNSRSLPYYYTYGSALTFFAGSDTYPNACQRAEAVFSELMASYGDDPTTAAIVAEGRQVCASTAAQPQSTIPPIPTVTPSPSP